ncbi:hypothetical protein UM181_14990 [Alphaproteobacteria bacterium US3C007]|nr:hypothetical protein UM181_14990 [Alphaproteobacteria bacterium US3C007]
MSEIRATTISDAAGTGPIALTKQSAAKHWTNFDGRASLTLRDSLNQSSVTDLGAGSYTVSLISSMDDSENYCVLVVKQDLFVNTHTYGFDAFGSRTASSYRAISVENAVLADSNNINGTVNGDLA